MNRLIDILSNIIPNVDFTKQKNLIDDKIITSFQMIQLISDIEDEFDIEISSKYIVKENFNSVEDIFNLIQKLEEE